jgi:hypothetical protein
MKSWKETFKPRGTRRLQLLLAGLMWSLVGTGLLAAGVIWTTGGDPAGRKILFLVAAVAAGLLKSRLILDRSALKIADRIARRGEGRCLGGLLSVGSWGLVLAMILLGRILRHFLPPAVAGVLYCAVGTGLLFSSRIPWLAWLRMKE